MPALYRSPGFCCVNLANFLDGLCYFGMLPLLVLFLQSHFGADDRQAGLVFSYYVGMVTLLMFPGGAICDRLGSRRALTLALVLLGIGRSWLVLAAQAGWPLPSALGALTLMATGTGIVQPSVYAAVKEYTRPEQTTSGFAWLYAIMNLGTVVWFLISPSVRAWRGMDGVYLVLALTTWANAALMLWFFRQEPYQKGQGRERPAFDRGLLQPRFLAFICMLVPVRNLVAHLSLTLPVYLKRVFPTVEPWLEYFFALHNLLLFAMTPVLARWLGKWALLPLMILGSMGSACACLGFVWPGAVAGVLVFVVVFSIGEAIWQARFYEYVARTAPGGRVGAAMSLANFPWFLTKTSAGLYSGDMLRRFVGDGQAPHPETLWLIYGAVACLTPLALAWSRRWLEAMPAETEQPVD